MVRARFHALTLLYCHYGTVNTSQYAVAEVAP